MSVCAYAGVWAWGGRIPELDYYLQGSAAHLCTKYISILYLLPWLPFFLLLLLTTATRHFSGLEEGHIVEMSREKKTTL